MVRAVIAGLLCVVCLGDLATHAAAPPPVPAAAPAATPVTAASTQDLAPPPDPSQGVVFICPMDPDIRSHAAGVCRRCGMTLVAGIPDPVEFHVDTRIFPASPTPGQPAVLQFLISDPWKGRPISSFNVVHEKLFHAFVVSQDLEFFEHGHPTQVADGVFQYPIVLSKPGMFRVLADFYPSGATPQLVTDTIIVPGGSSPEPVQLGRDYSTQSGANLRVSLTTIPEQPLAGTRTQLRLKVEGTHGLERYLGAWAHMLAASADLIDLMHEHPFRADGGPEVEFEIVFPREGGYRLWIQLQSGGAVNTVHFDVPVGPPPGETPDGALGAVAAGRDDP
jgi:hypothetical protein